MNNPFAVIILYLTRLRKELTFTHLFAVFEFVTRRLIYKTLKRHLFNKTYWLWFCHW